MNLFRRWRNSVERKIVLLVIVLGVVPMGLASVIVLNEAEAQAVTLAEKQLRLATKTFALEIFDRLDHAALEMKLLHISGGTESDLVGALRTSGVDEPLERRILHRTPERLSLSFDHEGRRLTGVLHRERLFAGISDVPSGVERCVIAYGQSVYCTGGLEAAVEKESELLQVLWTLPLASVYQTNLELAISARQTRESALRHLSLVSRLLPLLMLLVISVCGGALVVLIRRRMAPLAQLEGATLAIRDGRYDTQVAIDTNDEFEQLGDAFNLMARRLDRSFAKSQGLARIDRLVLDGNDVDQVIAQALRLAADYYQRPCFAYLWQDHCRQGRLLQMAGTALQTVELCLLSEPGTPRNDVDHRAALEHVLGVGFGRSAAIRVDGATAGELLLSRDGSEASGDFETLEELADRISVAATNLARARSLYRQATYDSLTGLINRQAFTDRVSAALSRTRRDQGRGAVLFLDLDRFKQVNDTEGHLVGDELLRVIARRLIDVVRESDTVARLGGDEFAIVLSDCGSDNTLSMLCRRIIEVVNEPVEIDRLKHEVDVSIGVSIFPDDGRDTGTLLMKADVAMYEAKSKSGSAYSFYDSSLNEASERRVMIESGIRSGLAHNTLKLYYQPKVELASMQVRGVEGLLRWRDGQRLRYSPAEFIPVAEETGLIHRFTELLVEEAAECLTSCRSAGLDPGRVAVNISTRQFVRQGFARSFLALVEASGLSPEDLEIEITESLFVQDAAHVTRELTKLREAGVRVALDDFGTGYSSLNMLRLLPLHTVKIDSSFISPLRGSAEARRVTQKIIEIASVLDLEVVAEGVEHWQEISLLDRLGCHYVQGHVFEKAMALPDLITYLGRVAEEGVHAEYRVAGSG